MVSAGDYYYSNGATGVDEKKHSSIDAVRNVIGVIIALSIAAMIAGAVLKYRYPDVFFKMALAVDVLNLKGDTKQEKARINKITLLPISREKQELLVNKTIFLGATPTMVQLALGAPRGKNKGYNAENKIEERWQYHFADEGKPVVMIFVEDKLTGAQRVSQQAAY
jgi:hypothetical protein